ncbi:hypothetical protein R9X47_25780 [Wukongibacter baidiensis]|uniref:hypothetical protein n=1 Tax=Wukongibacter baidiensis TaxID=1723361 RepID=UPI003D7F6F77
MIIGNELIKMNLDPIPKYRLMRDVIKLSKDNPELIGIKKEVLETKWVKDIVNLQWEDGSWGQFHSMSQFLQSAITTEQALRRLLILGLDKDDKPIQRAFSYMKKYLLRELDLRDYKEKKHDWDLLTRLFVATWMLIIDPSDELASGIAKDWAKIISHAFSEDTYNHEYYKEAYYEIHRSPKEKYMWRFQNFYVVAILPRYLSKDIESKFLDYIMNSEQGIYYIYDKCLNTLPDSFCSKLASRYINAYELLSRYSLSTSKCQHFNKWINENISEDGFWDMKQSVKDRIHFPLSNSWRKALNRKIDCTVRIQALLSRF